MSLLDPKTGEPLTEEQLAWLYENARPVLAQDEQRITDSFCELYQQARNVG